MTVAPVLTGIGPALKENETSSEKLSCAGGTMSLMRLVTLSMAVTSLDVVSESINEKAIQTDSNSETTAIKRTSSEPPVVAPPSLIKTEDNKSHEDTMG